MIVGTPPGWSKGASELLKQFLETQTGQLFLAQLATTRPSLSGSEEINAVALRAKYVGGYEACLAKISTLSEPPPVEDGKGDTDELYPDLDDESKWKDGQPPKTEKK